MLFKYKAVDEKGINKEGEIDASSRDMVINALQQRGLIVIGVYDKNEDQSFFKMTFFEKVKHKDVVILSRQMSTLFEAQVSALKAFTLLSENSDNKLLSRKLSEVCNDLQAGSSISGALAKHKDVFSEFYVNMVKAGEETGKLNETFSYLAAYLDRQYELTTKTKNALIYPAFVIFTFFAVMTLMFTVVIPKLAEIILDSGQPIPFYTKIVIGISNLFVHYGFIFLIFIIMFGIYIAWIANTPKGKDYIDRVRLSLPLAGDLYKKLFLSRISDNLNTMLTSGIPIIRSIDITAEVVDSHVYKKLLKDVADRVKSGLSISDSFAMYHEQIPNIMIQMIKVGEETGSLGQILKTLSDFYKREVDDAIDTMVGLIEPVMIVVLGVGVGFLLVSVLVPIYNLAGAIN
ncbi:MAG: type II secretion system F family protein [bacterium]|nr:type II secretion system F family protein [bacterium]